MSFGSMLTVLLFVGGVFLVLVVWIVFKGPSKAQPSSTSPSELPLSQLLRGDVAVGAILTRDVATNGLCITLADGRRMNLANGDTKFLVGLINSTNELRVVALLLAEMFGLTVTGTDVKNVGAPVGFRLVRRPR